MNLLALQGIYQSTILLGGSWPADNNPLDLPDILRNLIPDASLLPQSGHASALPIAPHHPAIMPASRHDLFALLERLGIETATVEHPPLFTVEQSKRLRGEIPGAHTKNLFLKSKKGELVLITALESTPIALAGAHKLIGCGRLSFGKPELLYENLGIQPGSVTPFALMNASARGVNFILDAALMAFGVLNFHPLENTATTSISSADFMRFLKEAGHEPHILDFSQGTEVESKAQV
jgi:Ala-tRNA(Pro) deacylase